MALTRRDILGLCFGTAAAALFPAAWAHASNGVVRAIAEFTRGAIPLAGGVQLTAPQIADNGGAVPIRVAAEGARRIALFADGNPNPGAVVFAFGPWVRPAATIRIRLARSQQVIAVAEMADGTFRTTSRAVAVTVGGCG